LKMYLGGYRNEGIYYEAVTNKILDDLVKVTKPRSMILEGRFGVRGGISSVVTASYDKGRPGRR
ncbi:MAG: NADPH-dependent 7-cyano-7-deazaguanine reductase QueF, partial [Vicinamibacteria bacterium]